MLKDQRLNPIVNSETIEYDAEAGADYHHVETKLLDKSTEITQINIGTQEIGTLSLLFYLESIKVTNIDHHTLFLTKILRFMPKKFMKILNGL